MTDEMLAPHTRSVATAEEGGVYEPASRTITWFIGQVDPGEEGERYFTANARDDAPCGTEVTNFATVYFPSVPETTPTNGVSVTVIGPSCDEDEDDVTDTEDNCPRVPNGPAEEGIPGVGDQTDTDGDGQDDACDSDDDNDEMLDAFEVLCSCLNPTADDAALDPDGDGLTNLDEFNLWEILGLNTNPCDPDTDGDTCSDGNEVNKGWDPLDRTDFPDVNADHIVDSGDMIIIANHVLCQPADGCYDPFYDVNSDGILDSGEMIIMANHVLAICP